MSSLFAAGYGVIMGLVALNPWFWASPPLLVLAGPSMSVCNTSANSYLQATAPAQPRGRSVSLFMCAMRGGLSIASLLTGLTVSVLGVREALLINGILAVAGQIIVGRAWLRARVPKTSAWSRDRPTD